MLKEKITFKDELPINLLAAEIDEYPIHFHDEPEVVFILRGKVSMRNGYYTYQLKKGDIFILNDREIHSFSKIEGEENLVMMLQLDLKYFSNYYSNLKNSFFVTDMEDDDDESLDVLKNILAKIMMDVLQKGYGYEHKVIESAHNLISSLESDFRYFLMEDGKFVNETKKKGNKIMAGRLNRITDYMYENYNRKLTLKEIAEREHLSVYYLSHVIKEATGLSFQELLSFIRVEESEKLLLGTKKKIGAVADETGFSAVRYYIKHFENWFGMHPMEYRKKYTGRVSGRESSAKFRRALPAEIEKALREEVKGEHKEYNELMKSNKVIVEVDLNNEKKSAARENNRLLDIMGRPEMKALTEPYKIFKNLGGEVVATGDNYIVKADCEKNGDVKSLSVLTVQYDKNYFEGKSSTAVLEERIKDFDEGLEFLLRCTRLFGEFSVSRYKMSKENSLMTWDRAVNRQGDTNLRETIRKKWATRPAVEFSDFYVADTLSLRSALKGFSAEIILIDKKESQ